MSKIEIYSKAWCPYCKRAKHLLQKKSLEYIEIDITNDAETEQKMIARSHSQTVPQIFIDDQLVGGYDKLARLNATGGLEQLLAS